MAEGNLTFTVQPDVEIYIESIGGDLVIEAHDKAEIRATGDQPSIQIQDTGKRARVVCGGDCRMRVPAVARITINSVGGDTRLAGITGALKIDRVSADLRMVNIGSASVDWVGGDLEIRRAAGDIRIDWTGNEATLTEIDGDLDINNISSDATIRAVKGNCTIDNIGSDLSLDMNFQPGSERRYANAGGNVRIRIETDVDESPAGTTEKVNNSEATANRSELRVNSVGSDAKIANVPGRVHVEHIGNDLHVSNIGPLTIGWVGNDLEIRRVDGDVHVDSVGSDLNVNKVAGNLNVGSVGSDALIKAVRGMCLINSIGSDLVLDTSFAPGIEHHYGSVGSDVLAKVDSGASVRFIIPEDIEHEINVPGTRIESDGDEVMLILADGRAIVKIESIGSEFALVGRDNKSSGPRFDEVFPGDFENPFQNLNVDEMVTAELEREHDRLRRETDQIRRQAERARREGERMAEQVREQAKRGRSWNLTFGFGGKNKRGAIPPIPPIPPVPPIPPIPPIPGIRGFASTAPSDAYSEPVSDKERLLILQMLENGKINVAEAERLLAALEGRE